jgi:hypothetical protein
MDLLVNAILARALHQNPWDLFIGILAVCVICALLVRGALYAVLALMDWLHAKWSAKYRAKKRREQNAELQRKYEGVCARVVELEGDNVRLVAENIRIMGLLGETRTHNVSLDKRIAHEIDVHNRGAG